MLNTPFLCADFGELPSLCICLGFRACTSENDAFKRDTESNRIHSQRESDISSFFEGQVPTSLLSAPDIVAAGECVETGNISWHTSPVIRAFVQLDCPKEALMTAGRGG